MNQVMLIDYCDKKTNIAAITASDVIMNNEKKKQK
jgi:hypothetical protein